MMATLSEIELLRKIHTNYADKCWDELLRYLDPKVFVSIDSGNLVNFQILATVAQLLTDKANNISDKLKVVLLKCTGNSCFTGYKHKNYDISDSKVGKYCHRLYSILADMSSLQNEVRRENLYPFCTHFPYNGIAEWCTDYVVSYSDNGDNVLSPNQMELLRLSIQFLCNLFTFACNDETIPECVIGLKLKEAIIKLIIYENKSISRAACIFIHNALNDFPKTYFTADNVKCLCSLLMKPVKESMTCAKEVLIHLLNKENTLKDVYRDLPMEDRIYLLETMHIYVSELSYQLGKDVSNTLSENIVEFLVERFCRQSDLILKTVDTYVEGMEPTEVIILLDILCTLSSKSVDNFKALRANKSLLINCTYLLKSIHMMGKSSGNYFTPVQKLKDVAPSVAELSGEGHRNSDASSEKCQIQEHPAFGFKAGLIRVIGNMSYQNKVYQDMLREMDAIPLLLDCCNIDARNPLIIQWTILAVRNLCERNAENQEIIRNSSKVGSVKSSVLREMGLTLHEDADGKSIGIVPLIREESKQHFP